jgi:type IV pilus assembly protein PilW
MRKFSLLHRRTSQRQSIRGLSLIELMIAMVLGLFLIGGVISIFVSNQQSFRDNEGLARIQENARFAFEQLSREVRDAGSIPCGVHAVNSVVRLGGTANTGVPWWGDWNAGTFRVHDSAVTSTVVAFGATTNDRVTGTDAVTILRASLVDNFLRTVVSHDTSTNRITLNSSANYEQGDLALICDGFSAAIFEVSTSSSPNIIGYAADTLGQNCSDALGWKPNVNCTSNAVVKRFAPGSLVTKLDPAFWYIGVGQDNQGRSLYRVSVKRERVTPGSTTRIVKTEPREMVPGVNDLQIDYLLRIRSGTGTATFALDTDWKKDETGAQFTAGWGETQPNQVTAARLTLDFVSDVRGTDGEPLKRQSISVVSLRNREIAK